VLLDATLWNRVNPSKEETMADVRNAAQQVKTALDKIAAAKNNPEQLQQAITDAKTKVDQLIQQAGAGQE
jgi:RNase P/RNase MRP subunit p30